MPPHVPYGLRGLPSRLWPKCNRLLRLGRHEAHLRLWRTSKLNLCISYVEVGSCENKDGGSDVSVFMCKVNLTDHTSSPHNVVPMRWMVINEVPEGALNLRVY
jgi:hypothetical protein